MAPFKDYYKILGLPQTCEQIEIKATYRALALKHHPDKNPDDKNATAKFQYIVEAYEKLSDANSRYLFDLEYNHQNRCKAPVYEEPVPEQPKKSYCEPESELESESESDSDSESNPNHGTFEKKPEGFEDENEQSFGDWFNAKYREWENENDEEFRKRQDWRDEQDRRRLEELAKEHAARFFYHKLKRDRQDATQKRANGKDKSEQKKTQDSREREYKKSSNVKGGGKSGCRGR